MYTGNPLTQHETSGRLGFRPALRVFTGVSLAYLVLTFLFYIVVGISTLYIRFIKEEESDVRAR